jgi:hypothetical protein
MTDFLPRRLMLRRAAMLAAAGAFSSTASAATTDGAVAPAKGSSPIDHGADPTGGRDATEALRRWVAQGGELVLPAGSRFAVSDTITVSQPGTRIAGRGTLVARAGVVGKALLAIGADDCIIDGIYLDNPDRVGVADGLQSFGIELFGHRNRVLNCTVHDFQMCLGVSPTGEFYDNVFAFNHCRVLGVGQYGKGKGEDRGDGIADFGARTRIIGNMIEAASGRGGINDCRIGIDVEGLFGLEHDAGNVDNHTGSEVIGNVVVPSPDGSGRFRRCYSVEGINHCRVADNYGRGWTWCGLWLVGSSHYSVVTGNVFRQDVVGSNRNGTEWNPDRAGILIYATLGVALHDVLVSNNVVDIASADCHGIQVHGPGGSVSGIVVSDNVCSITHRAVGATPCGLLVTEARDVRMFGNRINGPWRYGVRVQECRDVEVTACRISGIEGFALSVQGATVRLGQNSIGACAGGIESAGNAEYLIDGNHLKDISGVGINLVDGGNGIVSGNIGRGAPVRVIRLGNTSGAKFIGNIGFAA